jgi:serine/threonine protein kinase
MDTTDTGVTGVTTDTALSVPNQTDIANSLVSILASDSKSTISKDLIIVTLLEYICNTHDKQKMFYQICGYLTSANILTGETLHSLEYTACRTVFMNVINTLLHGHKTITDSNDVKQDALSRYKSDFIEIERIGKGGFGSVYKAINKLDQVCYAIKKIPVPNITNPKCLNEVHLLAKLNDPHVVRYFGTWIELTKMTESIDEFTDSSSESDDSATLIPYDDKPQFKPVLYIQMELCYTTLDEYLIERNYSGSDAIVKEDLEIFGQIIKGLAYIHGQNIIHGDLTPKNIFLDENMRVKIGDFGLATKYNKFVKTVPTDNSFGNTIYLAPERYEQHICCLKSDIYSLGVIFFELLHPFNTIMEKLVTIDTIKDGDFTGIKQFGKISDVLTNKIISYVRSMIEHDIDKRLDVTEVCKIYDNEYRVFLL